MGCHRVLLFLAVLVAICQAKSVKKSEKANVDLLEELLKLLKSKSQRLSQLSHDELNVINEANCPGLFSGLAFDNDLDFGLLGDELSSPDFSGLDFGNNGWNDLSDLDLGLFGDEFNDFSGLNFGNNGWNDLSGLDFGRFKKANVDRLEKLLNQLKSKSQRLSQLSNNELNEANCPGLFSGLDFDNDLSDLDFGHFGDEFSSPDFSGLDFGNNGWYDLSDLDLGLFGDEFNDFSGLNFGNNGLFGGFKEAKKSEENAVGKVRPAHLTEKPLTRSQKFKQFKQFKQLKQLYGGGCPWCGPPGTRPAEKKTRKPQNRRLGEVTQSDSSQMDPSRDSEK